MDAVIDSGVGLRFVVPEMEAVHNGRQVMVGEVNDGRGAAEGRRLHAGVVIVAGFGVRHRQVEVDMRVNPAGKNEHPFRVNSFGIGDAVKILPDRGNLLTVNQDVGFVHI